MRKRSMRPNTLSETYDRIIAGEPREKVFAEFLDTFYTLSGAARQSAALAAEPASSAAGALACAGGTRLADPLDAPFPPHAASSARVATSGPDRSRRPPR